MIHFLLSIFYVVLNYVIFRRASQLLVMLKSLGKYAGNWCNFCSILEPISNYRLCPEQQSSPQWAILLYYTTSYYPINHTKTPIGSLHSFGLSLCAKMNAFWLFFFFVCLGNPPSEIIPSCNKVWHNSYVYSWRLTLWYVSLSFRGSHEFSPVIML